MLANRKEAGEKLAHLLASYRDQRPLVLAIPRGAVEMASIIAEKLYGDLDLILVHKLGHPMNPEFAIGAVDEDGRVYLDDSLSLDQIPIKYLESERLRQWQNLANRRQYYTPHHKALSIKNRVVILVDDGIATGWTLKAAIQSIDDKKPAKIIVAVGVASPEGQQEIAELVDEVVSLLTPTNFQAVGLWYNDFTQVSDEDIIKILRNNTNKT